MDAVLVAGHVCIDLIPQLAGPPSVEPGRLIDTGALRIEPGGCVANTARALAGLGIPVRLAATVGDDDLGRVLIDLLERSGADTSGIGRADGSMTSYSIVIDSPGRDRTFWHHIGANRDFDGSDIDLDGLAVLHVGYPTHLPALLALDAEPLRRLLERARAAHVTTSIDLAEIDPRSPAAELPWEALLPTLLPLVDVITPSVDDLRSMLPSRDLDAAAWAKSLVEWGTGVALVTAGRHGMALRTSGLERLQDAGVAIRGMADTWHGRSLRAAPAPVAVVASTGAGDSASAGFLAALVRGAGPEAAVRLAAATAGARIGGLPFDRADELSAEVLVD